MIYMIRGTSRSGKTLLAHKIMQKRGISYLSPDWLVRNFNKGIQLTRYHRNALADAT